MGLLGKIFGGGSSIAKLRKAIDQKRFADASLFAEELAGQQLPAEEVAELETLRIIAGDGLARLNLDEALGLRRNDSHDLADEHLLLAKQQVCSPELSEEIAKVIAAKPLEGEISQDELPSKCSSCTPQATQLAPEDANTDDADCQLELILTSYPPSLAVRYTAKSETFKTAFLLTHAGNDEQALPIWQQLDKSEHDDLYWFEFGSLLGRQGDLPAAQAALETALGQNPKNLLVVEALITIFMANSDYLQAQQLLQQILDQDGNKAFCHAQLTLIQFHLQDYTAAANHARHALAAGNTETGFILLAAAVLERSGALEETEQVLKMVPASQCTGSTSLPLAEFWLRHKQHLPEILDTFNAACREEPNNPQWQLRVAQTYLARNWKKDGIKLLRKVVDDPRLEPELAEEANNLLAELS